MRVSETVWTNCQPRAGVQRSVRFCRKSEISVFRTRKVTVFAKSREVLVRSWRRRYRPTRAEVTAPMDWSLTAGSRISVRKIDFCVFACVSTEIAGFQALWGDTAPVWNAGSCSYSLVVCGRALDASLVSLRVSGARRASRHRKTSTCTRWWPSS